MITPEYLDTIIEGTESACAQLNNDLIQIIAKRVQKTFDYYGEVKFIPSTINDFHKLLDQGMIAKDIEKALENALPSISEEIKKAFKESAKEIGKSLNGAVNERITVVDAKGNKHTSKTDKKTLEGLPQGTALTSAEKRRMEAIFRRTNQSVFNITKTTATMANRAFMEACDDAFMRGKAGISMNQAVAEAVSSLAKKGITTVTFASGHVDRMEVAVARAVRTGINQANADVILTRCAEMNVGYVRVSSHHGARVTDEMDYTNHAWWQGKVYKLDYSKAPLQPYKAEAEKGKDEYPGLSEFEIEDADYPDFVDACGFGQIQGICGVNCRHTFFPFFPGVSINTAQPIPPGESREEYKHSQNLRSMERSIRDTNRQLEAVKALRTKEADSEAIALKQRLNSQVNKYNAYKSNSADIDPMNAWAINKEIKSFISEAQSPLPKDIALAKVFTDKANELKEMLDTLSIGRESKWSGKARVSRLIMGFGAKKWNCDIVLAPNATESDMIHELLHSYSISHMEPKRGKKFYADHPLLEEGAVELFTEEICKRQGIPFKATYEDSVNRLRKVAELGNEKDIFSFALEVIKQPLDLRGSWLDDYADRIVDNLSSSDIVELRSIVRELKRGIL